MNPTYSIGIISDIHSNLEALQSVLAHIKSEFPNLSEIYCLGDIVGYGSDPKSCLEIVFQEKLITKIVKGNHDHFVAQAHVPPQINSFAAEAIHYQIRNTPIELKWELSNLPLTQSIYHVISGKEILLTHGSPQYPLSEYIYDNTKKQERLFEYMISNNVDILLLGHTHIPYVRKIEDPTEKEIIILNPGSVGQPRDSDPRASYAVLNLENYKVDFVKVDYNVDLTYQKIITRDLAPFLGQRLYKGL